MGALRILGNMLWHVPFLGFLQAFMTFIAGCLFMATVIGAPIGLGLIEYSKFLLWPFGKAMVSKNDLNIKQNETWKKFSFVIMILYLPFGIVLCVLAAVQVAFVGITLIGIPSALVIAKSLGTFLNPVFKKCVHISVAEELEKRKANKEVEKYLGNSANEDVSHPLTNSAPIILSDEETSTGPAPQLLAQKHDEPVGESTPVSQETYLLPDEVEREAVVIPETEATPSSHKEESSAGPNKLVIVFVAIAIVFGVFGAIFGFNKWQSTSKYKVNQAEAAIFINNWCSVQSNKEMGQYANLYAPDFQGIKRTKSGKTHYYNCSEWLSDRSKLYKRVRYLSVTADNIAVKDFDSGSQLTTVQFTQRYSSDRYNDQGTKLVKLRKAVDGSIRIANEEMLSSY